MVAIKILVCYLDFLWDLVILRIVGRLQQDYFKDL